VHSSFNIIPLFPYREKPEGYMKRVKNVFISGLFLYPLPFFEPSVSFPDYLHGSFPFHPSTFLARSPFFYLLPFPFCINFPIFWSLFYPSTFCFHPVLVSTFLSRSVFCHSFPSSFCLLSLSAFLLFILLPSFTLLSSAFLSLCFLLFNLCTKIASPFFEC
jgi:hypothetical protein